MPNNFDQSSTGINIECNVFYDSLRAQDLFRENFDYIESDNRFKADLYWYRDYGNIAGFESVKFTLKATRAELLRYGHDNINYDDYTDEELQEHIADYVGLNICSYFSDTDMFKDFDIEAVPSTPIKRVLVRGYIQGDASYVIYAPELLKEAWGREDVPSDSEIVAPFVNYFYDAPIYGTCTINGEEYPYYDCEPKSDYEYDRARWIDHILAHHAAPEGLTREMLESVIPQEPSYD